MSFSIVDRSWWLEDRRESVRVLVSDSPSAKACPAQCPGSGSPGALALSPAAQAFESELDFPPPPKFYYIFAGSLDKLLLGSRLLGSWWLRGLGAGGERSLRASGVTSSQNIFLILAKSLVLTPENLPRISLRGLLRCLVCEYGSWNAWGECSVSCGRGIRRSQRQCSCPT